MNSHQVFKLRSDIKTEKCFFFSQEIALMEITRQYVRSQSNINVNNHISNGIVLLFIRSAWFSDGICITAGDRDVAEEAEEELSKLRVESYHFAPKKSGEPSTSVQTSGDSGSHQTITEGERKGMNRKEKL